MNVRTLACCVAFAVPFGSAAQNAVICPDFATANSRLQARATTLINEWNKEHTARVGATVAEQQAAAQTQIQGAGLQFAIALYSVIAARAKEEARIWLTDQLADRICITEIKSSDDETTLTNPRFPNTCAVLASRSEYPGASLSVLRTGLRRDIYSLPACYGYLQLATDRPGFAAESVAPTDDDEIDPYLLEALLVAVYLKFNEDARVDPNLPQLPEIESDELAKLLAAVATARFRTTARARAISCSAPSADQLKKLVDQLKNLLDSAQVPATPEAVLTLIVETLREWKCETHAKAIEVVASTYASAVRGNYLDAALEAAVYVCSTSAPKADRPLCARLPLLGEVASAQTTEELSAALDRVISPVGAWKRKQSDPLWSLTSMVGATLGRETLKSDTDKASHGTTGLYAPLGVERSFPARKSTSRLGGYALGLTMLDGGALLTYAEEDELDGGETSSTADSELSNIVSPGMYFAVAIRNSPFRVGISVSRTPELRSVDFGGGVEETVDSERVALFFSVDVTLFSFEGKRRLRD